MQKVGLKIRQRYRKIKIDSKIKILYVFREIKREIRNNKIDKQLKRDMYKLKIHIR